jgi:hypothetical protein
VLPVPTEAQLNRRTRVLLEELGTLLREKADCWTAGAFARSSSGAHLGVLSPEATRRDVYGLLVHVRDHVLPPPLLPPGVIDEAYYKAVLHLERAARAGQYDSLLVANDEGGYQVVCDVVTRACRAAALLCEAEPHEEAPLSLAELVTQAPR